jgi:RluA family pseudouridine synthase
MGDIIKLSSPKTGEFWELEILYEDDNLLALNKPSGLLSSPDRYDPERPNLMKLLHHDIERATGWVRKRGLAYLANAHRLDFETSGIMLMAKDKPSLIALADQFGSLKPLKTYIALVHGHMSSDGFEVDAKIGPHPSQIGLMRVDRKNGKHAKTRFEVRERFEDFTLLNCMPLTGRTHQIRVHLKQAGLAIVGDKLYGGKMLFLSQLKKRYRLKGAAIERPLMGRVALHAESLVVQQPLTGQPVTIVAPWPKDINVAIKYLRRYSAFTEPTPDDGSLLQREPPMASEPPASEESQITEPPTTV